MRSRDTSSVTYTLFDVSLNFYLKAKRHSKSYPRFVQRSPSGDPSATLESRPAAHSSKRTAQLTSVRSICPSAGVSRRYAPVRVRTVYLHIFYRSSIYKVTTIRTFHIVTSLAQEHLTHITIVSKISCSPTKTTYAHAYSLETGKIAQPVF